jgi:mannose-6-phosphate isomerase-like protein (cupin superfamily)
VAWQTTRLGAEFVLAPDGSQIRSLVSVSAASMVHCRLEASQVTQAVRHRTVEEVWFCVAGAGQMWRGANASEEVVDVEPGVALSIPLGTAFQFRASDAHALEVVITTVPPWPGGDEAVPVRGKWSPTV